MGGSSSLANERYMSGKTFQKYFKEDIWPVHEGVFVRLGLTEPRAFKLFAVFASIDYNRNGSIDSIECFRYFQAPRTKFTERIFFFDKRDPDTNELIKSLNFKEFVLLFWSFCTLTPEGIARYIFEIFDVENAFSLTRAHLETMYRMLYQVDEVEEEYISFYPLQDPSTSRPSSNRNKNNGLLQRSTSEDDSIAGNVARIHGHHIKTADDYSSSSNEHKYQAPEQQETMTPAPRVAAISRFNRRSFAMDNTNERGKPQRGSGSRFFRSVSFIAASNAAALIPETIISDMARKQRMVIDKVTFQTVSAKNPNLLIYPALYFQKILRKKTCGVSVWKLLSVFRKSSFFAVFDRDSDRLDEAHMAMFRAVENQVLESKPITADTLVEQNSAKLRYDADAAQRELQMREKQEMIERRRYELTGPDLPMKKAWQMYEAKQKVFENEEFITAKTDVMRRKAMRMELFQYLDNAIDKSRDYYLYKDEKDLRVAEGTETDHEQRYEDFRDQRPEGKQITLLVEITHLLRLVKDEIDAKNAKNKYYREDQKTEKQVLVETNLAGCVKLLDPILKYDEATVSLVELDKRLTVLTRRDLTEELTLAKRVGSRAQWNAARLSAHKELVLFTRARTVRQAREDMAKAQEQHQRDWKKAEWYAICTYGSRITQWEYVLEKETNKPCYISSLTGERKHPKTAFCEQCDAIMVQHELRCVLCDAPRSAKNLLLYRPLGFKDITLE